MKAVLIIDVPDNIILGFSKANIEIKESAYLVNKDESKWKYTKPIKIEDVPLRPLPQKKEQFNSWERDFRSEASYRAGYNDCLEDIIEEIE